MLSRCQKCHHSHSSLSVVKNQKKCWNWLIRLCQIPIAATWLINNSSLRFSGLYKSNLNGLSNTLRTYSNFKSSNRSSPVILCSKCMRYYISRISFKITPKNFSIFLHPYSEIILSCENTSIEILHHSSSLWWLRICTWRACLNFWCNLGQISMGHSRSPSARSFSTSIIN